MIPLTYLIVLAKITNAIRYIVSEYVYEKEAIMDYRELAAELMQCRREMDRCRGKQQKNQEVRGELHVIYFFMEIEDHASPGELSDFCGVSTARMASILNSLEKKGLLLRSMDEKDHRKLIVRLTEKGVAYGTERRNEFLRDMAQMLEALGEHDAKEYIRITRKIGELHKACEADAEKKKMRKEAEANG